MQIAKTQMLDNAGQGIASDAAKNYFDLRSLDSLSKLSKQSDPEAKDDALRAVGGEFESILMRQMLKSMRKANEALFEDSLVNPESVRFYQDMYDDQLVVDLNASRSLGIAEQFVANVAGGSASESAKTDKKGDSVFPLAATDWGRTDRNPAYFSRNKLDTIDTDNIAIPSDKVMPNPQDVLANKSNAEKFEFDSPKSFIVALKPFATPIAQKLGIKVSQLIAQAALETGWGQKIIRGDNGENSFNLFGIKAGHNWNGESAKVLTTEYIDGQPLKLAANFRKYSSFSESFSDFFQFITTQSRYAGVLKETGEKFYSALQSAGYATDPNYAKKVSAIAARIESF